MVLVYADNGGVLGVQQPKRESFHPILAAVALWVEVGFKASLWGWQEKQHPSESMGSS